ncbi:unnamed protein product [Withania somnifera]
MGSDGPQTSSSFVSPSIYHVFLSFRGEDTRKTFTDSLYAALVGAGWRTFKDDNEIERGENIKTELENAIIHSRSSIIIISKNYATSTWCLDELVKILEHKRTKGHAILPVFYHVDPSEVRDQKNSFAGAFTRYERQMEAESDEGKREWMDKVQKWRAALGEVADSGGVLLNNQEDRKEAELIEEILQLIEDKLKRTISSVAPYLLQDGSHDDNVVAICGMSGIGKTTVAKYVFATNFRSFEGSSFVENIHDISQQPDGLIRLQKQLFYDLTGKKSRIQNTDDGIIKLRGAICFRRVLVILDDVDQQDQIHSIIGMKNWFCPGSKIIITTKNSCLLKVHEIQNVHKVREMVNDEALELYSWHSFGEDHPADDYLELSTRVVKHCGGLPLALQVLGSSLRGKIPMFGKGSETIEGLYFDRNMVKEDQSFMGSSSTGRKCLLTEVKSYLFSFSRHPIKFYSKSKDEIELGTDLFKVMNKLRLLQINYTHLNGGYKDFPKNLRWLYWRGFPLKCVPDDFPLESLAVLDMRNSCLERLWDGRRVLPLVKILNLSHSHSLSRTPDFSGFPMLEKLVFKECVNLLEIDESIGSLAARLILLNVKNCKRLQKLPRGICNLKNFRTLIISGCSNVAELPREMWRMQSLEVFIANEIPMNQLPSVRKENPMWHALIRSWVQKPSKVLKLPWVSLPKSLVKDFSNLMLLQHLDLSKNPISCLPACIRTLSRLKNLPRVHDLRVGQCTSLERVTYLSVGCRAKLYYLNGCNVLTDMEGSFKLEATGGVEKTMMSSELSMWGAVGSFEVKLYNHLTARESRGPVKVLFENGMISLFLRGSEVPNWFSHKSVGAALSFTVPALPDSKIQGITVCSAYTIDLKVWIKGIQFYLIIHNEQKNVKLIYSPSCSGIPEAQNEMLWFSHWKFQSEIGVHLIHGEQERMVSNSHSQEMQLDYPYQGKIPVERQGLIELYAFGYMGTGLDYIFPYIP